MEIFMNLSKNILLLLCFLPLQSVCSEKNEKTKENAKLDVAAKENAEIWDQDPLPARRHSAAGVMQPNLEAAQAVTMQLAQNAASQPRTRRNSEADLPDLYPTSPFDILIKSARDHNEGNMFQIIRL